MTTLTTGKATEFIQFTRASNATVTDSDGKVKWAPHNLLLASESFDAAAWVKTNVTATANAIAAPNGATTADQLFETTASGVHNQGQSVSSSAGQHTFAVYVKPAGRDFVGLYNAETAVGKIFDVSSGTVGSDMTAAPVSASITAVGGGWYRCEIVVNTAVTTTNWRVYTCNSSSTFSYVGDITKGIYLWGAHLYRSDLGGMQANTSAYPMYNPTTPKNLLGFSEAFDNAAWTKANATVTANTIFAPNGLQTADLVQASAGSGVHYVLQNWTAVVGTPVTVSFYAKAGSNSFVQFAAGADNPVANFDISTGTVGTTTSVTSATITAVGDGWYRCRVQYTVAAASTSFVISIVNSSSASRIPTWTAAGTETVYLWGAQLSDSASLDPYFPDYDVAPTSAAYYGPRRDFDPVTLACKGLLVEGQRTNLLLRSAEFDNATSWATGDGGAATVTADTAVSPAGGQTADTIDDTSGSVVQGRKNSVTITSGSGTYTGSVFIKKNTSNCAAVRVAISGGTIVAAELVVDTVNGVAQWRTANSGTAFSISPYGNGWYRCTVTVTDNASGNNSLGLEVRPAFASAYSPTIDAAATGSVYAWGAQLEAGSFATSYIPTGAATATRSADVASVSTQAFPYSATESSIVASVVSMGDGNTNIVQLSAANTPFGLLMYQSIASSAAFVDAPSTSLGAMTIGTNYKIGIAYNGSSNGAVRNGGTVSSVGTTLSAAATKMGIGSGFSGGGTFNGHIRQITYLPRRISNTELQTRTA